MKINLIRLLDKDNLSRRVEDDLLLEDLNEQLIEEDLVLEEGANDSPIDVILVEGDDVDKAFSKIVKRLKKFVYIFTFSNGRSYGQTLAIYTYLAKNNYHILLDDNPLEALKGILPTFIDISRIKDTTSGKTFGVFIPDENSFLKQKFNTAKLEKTFGISIIKISKTELFKEYKKNKTGNPPHLFKMKKMVKNSKALNHTLYLYGAMRTFIDKYHLVGVTIDQKILEEELGISPDLVLSILNEEGIVATDNSDLSTLLTGYLCLLFNSRAPYIVSPMGSNYDEKILSLKCDYPPLNQVKDYHIVNPHDLILKIESEVNLGEACLIKIANDCTHYYALSAEIKQSKDENIALYVDEVPLFNFMRDAAEPQMVMINQDISIQFSALLNYLEINK